MASTEIAIILPATGLTSPHQRFRPPFVRMYESTTPSSYDIEKKGQTLASHIISSVMEKYPLQKETWTPKNEKVPKTQ